MVVYNNKEFNQKPEVVKQHEPKPNFSGIKKQRTFKDDRDKMKDMKKDKRRTDRAEERRNNREQYMIANRQNKVIQSKSKGTPALKAPPKDKGVAERIDNIMANLKASPARIAKAKSQIQQKMPALFDAMVHDAEAGVKRQRTPRKNTNRTLEFSSPVTKKSRINTEQMQTEAAELFSGL